MSTDEYVLGQTVMVTAGKYNGEFGEIIGVTPKKVRVAWRPGGDALLHKEQLHVLQEELTDDESRPSSRPLSRPLSRPRSRQRSMSPRTPRHTPTLRRSPSRTPHTPTLRRSPSRTPRGSGLLDLSDTEGMATRAHPHRSRHTNPTRREQGRAMLNKAVTTSVNAMTTAWRAVQRHYRKGDRRLQVLLVLLLAYLLWWLGPSIAKGLPTTSVLRDQLKAEESRAAQLTATNSLLEQQVEAQRTAAESLRSQLSKAALERDEISTGAAQASTLVSELTAQLETSRIEHETAHKQAMDSVLSKLSVSESTAASAVATATTTDAQRAALESKLMGAEASGLSIAKSRDTAVAALTRQLSVAEGSEHELSSALSHANSQVISLTNQLSRTEDARVALSTSESTCNRQRTSLQLVASQLEQRLTLQDGLDNSAATLPVHDDLANSSIIVQRLLKVTHIEGDVHVDHNRNLDHLFGFRNLQAVGHDVKFDHNSFLRTIDTFWSLVEVNGRLILKSNPNLQHVNFPALKRVGGIRIEDCNEMESLRGLEKVEYIGHNLELFHNTHLVTMAGLNNLKMIVGHLHVVSDPGVDMDFNALRGLMCHGGIARGTTVSVPDWLVNKPPCDVPE
eukprot:m.19485 g.19485  ORF g.19485 m.19485 type:complete len:621 (-) comp3698_c0_seq2:67-1929(-)